MLRSTRIDGATQLLVAQSPASARKPQGLAAAVGQACTVSLTTGTALGAGAGGAGAVVLVASGWPEASGGAAVGLASSCVGCSGREKNRSSTSATTCESVAHDPPWTGSSRSKRKTPSGSASVSETKSPWARC